MKVTLNKSQYRAVNKLRGLPDDAHMMIMCSHPTATGGILEGSEQAFEELVSFISEELACMRPSASTSQTLCSIAVKIDPACADWLGM